jgi:hypothetical protein
MLKILLFLLCFTSPIANAKELLFEKGRITFASVNMRALKHTQFEIGFIDKKKIFNYHYHSFVTPLLFQEATYEDFIDSSKSHLRTNIGAIGVKFGGIFPINEDEPLYCQAGIGFAKINVQQNPFLGNIKNSLLKETRWAFHLGFIYKNNNLLARIEYTFSNKSFVDNDFLFSIGTIF